MKKSPVSYGAKFVDIGGYASIGSEVARLNHNRLARLD